MPVLKGNIYALITSLLYFSPFVKIAFVRSKSRECQNHLDLGCFNNIGFPRKLYSILPRKEKHEVCIVKVKGQFSKKKEDNVVYHASRRHRLYNGTKASRKQ